MEETHDTLVADLIILFPVWEESVWKPLQEKRYGEAAEAFSSLFRSLAPEERHGADWGALLRGVPAVRGKLSETEWNTHARPFLMRAFLEITTGRMVGEILNSFNPVGRAEMFAAIMEAIPGESQKEKTAWLARRKSSCAQYFLGTPAQIFASFEDPRAGATARARFVSLPPALQETLFSFGAASAVARAGTENLLNEEKIRAAARVIGNALLGLFDVEKLTEELAHEALVDQKTAAVLARELRARIFAPLLPDLEEAYRPPEQFMEIDAETISLAPPAAPETRTLSFAEFHKKISEPEEKPASAAKEQKNAPAPFVLHEEFPAVKDARKEFLKGFSLPFGLFRPKQGETATPTANVETPQKINSYQLPVAKDEEKPRTVHFSEYRTNVAPAEGSGEFINLETFGKTRINTDNQKRINADTPRSRTPTIPISPDTSSKSEIPVKRIDFAAPIPPLKSPQEGGADAAPASPKIEGNMIDLR